MLIRYGYEMTFTCSAPTPMICQLDLHPSCLPGVRAETPFAAAPHVKSWLYADVFGNRCRRFNAPAGELTISNAGVVEVSGLPDPVAADAAEVPVAELPDDTLLYLVGSLSPSRARLREAWLRPSGPGRDLDLPALGGVSVLSGVINTPPQRLWLVGDVEVAQICDHAKCCPGNVG